MKYSFDRLLGRAQEIFAQNPLDGHLFLFVTRDLSRAGVSLLHASQLFPGQRLDLVLNGEPPRHVEVVRCRRLKDGSYVVGCRFTKG